MRKLVGLLCCLALVGGFAKSIVAYNTYYGNLHSHCSYSWDVYNGSLPEDAYAYARDSAGIHVLAITDHANNGITPSQYEHMKDMAVAYSDPGVFVAIAGLEHGSLSTSRPGAFGHLNIYEPPFIIPQYSGGGDDFRYNLPGTYNWMLTHYDVALGKPIMGTFCHPYYTGGCEPDAQFRHFAYSNDGDSAMTAIEVMNGKRSTNYEPEYFDALEKGWHLGAVANQDNHTRTWGDLPSNDGDIYLTGIVADSLTRSSILRAMRQMRTVAMEVNPITDRMELYFSAGGPFMGTSFESYADSVDFSVTVAAENDFQIIQLLRNGTVVEFVNPDTNEFTWNVRHAPGLGNFYYIARARQTDGDYAWSSPIWINSYSTPYTAMAEVNADDVDGVPLLYNDVVTVSGIATVGTDIFSGVHNYIYVQDPTGGVNVVEYGGQSVTVTTGDSLLVTGTVYQDAGQTQIIFPDITVGGQVAVPDPFEVSTAELAANGENYEGLLVSVSGASIVSGTWPSEGQEAVLQIDDGSGQCDLLIDSDTDIDGTPEPQGYLSIVGVVRQHDTSLPYFSNYRLAPRDTSDIVEQSTSVTIVGGPTEVFEFGSYPNPFNPLTRIGFSIGAADAGHVSLKIYNIRGEFMRTLLDGETPPGTFVTTWDGEDAAGRKLPSGLYFCKIQTRLRSETLKLLLAK
jgi:hypothetical protein